MAKNYRNGLKWLPGVIVEQVGTLTLLVQLDNGMLWKRHVEQLRCLDDTPRNVTNSETSYSPTDVNEETPNGSSSDISDGTSPDSTQKTKQSYRYSSNS